MAKLKGLKELTEVLVVGQQMSNVIFNGQNNGPLAKWKDLQVQWDEATGKLRGKLNDKTKKERTR